MLVSEEFTPEVMLSAPRRSPAVPNHDGTIALCDVSTHVFKEAKTVKEVKVVDIETGASKVLSADDKIHDVLWIPGNSNDVIYLKSGDKGLTTIMVANAADISKEHYVVAEFSAPLRGLKLKALNDGTVAFAAVGLVGKDGLLFNDEAVESKSTARVFDGLQIRRWNVLVKDHKHAIWFSSLVLQDGRWSLAGELHNLLQDTDIDGPLGVYDIDDPTDNYDISPKGIAFAAEDPTNTQMEFSGTSYVYFAPLESFSTATQYKPRKMFMGTNHAPGYCGNVRFSPDASMLAYLFRPWEDIADARLYMGHLTSLGVFDAFKMVLGGGPALPPSSFEFAGNSETVLLLSDDCGRKSLSILYLHPHAKPTTLVRSGVVSACHPLTAGNWDKLLVSSSSMVDSSLWQVIDVTGEEAPRTVSSLTKHGARYGLSHSMMSEIWYEGADDACVHAFVIKPSKFDKNKKYPWVLLPHGGPEAQWADGWNTRWNIALWAEQGYVLVCPNIAGSTGYGIDFTSRIYGSWGGTAYRDLVNLMEYLQQIPYLDMDRATVAGGSYGGYMISWMFGHDLIRKFRCAIWHDGIFNLPSFVLQCDGNLGGADFKGVAFPWINSEELERWNPARPDLLKNWRHAPPTLIVHSEKDYRCPITEGLAVYNTLKAQGVTTRFLTFSDECHWVLNPENSIVWHKEVFDFIKKYSGGPGPVEYEAESA